MSATATEGRVAVTDAVAAVGAAAATVAAAVAVVGVVATGTAVAVVSVATVAAALAAGAAVAAVGAASVAIFALQQAAPRITDAEVQLPTAHSGVSLMTLIQGPAALQGATISLPRGVAVRFLHMLRSNGVVHVTIAVVVVVVPKQKQQLP
jgi:hypothetical protein